jgi:hypothetical protein
VDDAHVTEAEVATPPTSVPSLVVLDPGMGQWQQSMFPMGCMGWMIATTAVSCEAAAETSAVETIAMVAAPMTRRRGRQPTANRMRKIDLSGRSTIDLPGSLRGQMG